MSRRVERTADRIWRELRAALASIAADLDAVLRAHLGGPALRFEEIDGTGAIGAASFRIGGGRLRLTLRAGIADGADLVLHVESAGDGHAAEMHIDATNDRWWTTDEPQATHPLRDRGELERFLLSHLADGRRQRSPAGTSEPHPSVASSHVA